MTGFDWLDSFLRGWRGLVKKNTLDLSFDRIMSMNRKNTEDYFTLQLDVQAENILLGKLGHIYNMDEFGFQMNPRPDAVITEKGSPTLYQMVSGGKGGSVPVMACCNAEGCFAPPACTLKRGAPRNGKILFLISKIFHGWKFWLCEYFYIHAKEHVIPRKPTGEKSVRLIAMILRPYRIYILGHRILHRSALYLR